MDKSKLENVLCFDIETLAKHKDYFSLDKKGQELWEGRCNVYYHNDQREFEEDIKNRYSFYQGCWRYKACIVPEFSLAICISVGYYDVEQDRIVTKTFTNKSMDEKGEKTLVDTFFRVVQKFFTEHGFKYLAGHNIKQFDIPFLLKKGYIYGLNETIPNALRIRGVKPWDLNHILDTKEMYSFGGNFFKATLDEMCYVMDVESPKEGVVYGSKIYEYVYEENGDLDDIYTYCEADTKSTLELVGKLR